MRRERLRVIRERLTRFRERRAGFLRTPNNSESVRFLTSCFLNQARFFFTTVKYSAGAPVLRRFSSVLSWRAMLCLSVLFLIAFTDLERGFLRISRGNGLLHSLISVCLCQRRTESKSLN